MLILFLLTAGRNRLSAAPPSTKGAEVYREMCVKCHGRDGQGVKGKYDDVLRGDRSLEKLTRYIERAMPDDDPGKCVGEDATAVATYIYDAFYSREARLRNNPPRVELVRLTNRQYLNTVADLLKGFSGGDGPIPKEHGLQATYFGNKNFGRKFLERTDRQVDFNFDDENVESQFKGTNDFSIQWRGLLIADESGDYEFILKSPNGVRLWVNDEEEPTIDAWVASGQLTENRATVRLIGGRHYPLRLDLFKFKDKSSSVSLQWKPPRGVQQIIPARNLSPKGASPTFVVRTPFPPDDSSVGYERGVAVSKAWDEATTQAAIETANYMVANLNRLARTRNSETNRAAKVESFCAEFAARAFRRPLTAEQKKLLVADQFKSAKKLEDAVKRSVLLTLKSPQFLYLGLQNAKPDDYEVASRLSFGLWDSLPDRELEKLAAQGKLRSREQVTQQARRMLNDPRARAKMLAFFHHWLQMDRVEFLSKDDKIFPGFTPEIIADLRTSLDIFLEDAVWGGESDYRSLLLADYLFVNNRLAEFYGLTEKPLTRPTATLSPSDGERGGVRGQPHATNFTDDFVKVKPVDSERSGVLTHPYLLAAFSYEKQTSPIHRGVFLTRNIVGRALRPPPMAQTFDDASLPPNLTMREKVAQVTRPQACQSCHSVINPLGFSLEHFDAVGRFRTRENNRPIDAVSEYTTDEGETIRLAGARDVAEFAVASEQAQNGFIEQLFHQVAKQPMLAYGADVMDRLRQSFIASQFNMQKLLVDIATTSAMHGVEVQTAKKK